MLAEVEGNLDATYESSFSSDDEEESLQDAASNFPMLFDNPAASDDDITSISPATTRRHSTNPRVESSFSRLASKISSLSESEDVDIVPPPARGFFKEVHPSVLFVYSNIFLVVASSICTNPVYVLYFNDRGWTTDKDVFFYVLVTVLQPVLTVLLNPVFGFWQGRRSSKEIFLFDIVCTSFGYFTMAIIDSNRWVFLGGYILSRISLTQNSARTAYIIRTTSLQQRTQALAIQPMFALYVSFSLIFPPSPSQYVNP